MIVKIIKNDVTSETKHNIANVLNSFFLNKGKRISESMSTRPYDHYQYLKCNYINSLFFVHVASVDVEELILSLRNKPVTSIHSLLYFKKNKAPHYT